MPLATEFRLPLGNLGKAWYEATRRFGPYNEHPERCEDWNLESGGDTDLGEPLVAPFSGIVINARDWGGAWGKIVRILGRTPEGELVCWMGAHLDEIHVKPGDVVQVGDPVGTIGTADGRYAAHLHEQVTNVIEGEFELTVSGKTKILGPGSVAVIPSNTTHSGRSVTNTRVIDVFYPVREDYR